MTSPHSWEGRLGFAWPTFGIQMTAKQAATVGETIDLDALRAYGGDAFLRTFLTSWTAPRDCLNVMALMDVYYHFDEADHMVRLLLPKRRFT